MWCWAASGEMTMELLGASITQCDEANKRFGRTDCCNNPTPVGCINGGWPEYDKYGFTFSRTSDTALTWASPAVSLENLANLRMSSSNTRPIWRLSTASGCRSTCANFSVTRYSN